MPIDVTMPQLGESVSEGTITQWRVRVGDAVTKDQALLEVATDKADTEVPSPVAGRVVEIIANEGDVVPTRGVLCRIEEGAAGAASEKKPESSASKGSKTESTKREEKVSEPPASGTKVQDGSRAGGKNLATPTARKAALEHNVDLEQVQGSGERGRIVPGDVTKAAADRTQSAPAESSPRSASAPSQSSSAAQLTRMMNDASGFVPPVPGVGYKAFKVPPYRPQDGDKVVPFTRRRRITADHMTYSKVTSPHVVTVAEVDLHKAARLREFHKDRYKKEGLGLTMLSFVVMASARALRENANLNARVLDDSYVIYKDVNIGVAVDSPDGLVVPVIRRADELGVRGIVRGIDEMAKKARSAKLTADDLSGSTFSVTNPGIKGNLFGGAIINQPNVGILRMGEIQKRVVVVEGADGEDQMVIHPVMYMALSYDHRIVDGVVANSFLWRVTEILEKADFEVG